MTAKAAFFGNDSRLMDQVYGNGRREHLLALLDFYPLQITSQNFEDQLANLQQVQFIFSTWGMLELTAQQVRSLPALKAVFYSAGSVQYFARPFLENGVQVISAWAANGVPVAEFTISQMVLAAKGYFSAARQCRNPQGRRAWSQHYPGLFDIPIAILGAGTIGSRVIEMLKAYQVQLLVFDPFLSDEQAQRMKVRKVDLETAFREGWIVSNHIANLPSTRGLLTPHLFELLQPYATFINTGRGATIDEPGMLKVFERRTDLTALLDVTDPEPPADDSLLYQLDNVIVSPHIAGSLGNEVWRMADWMIEEYQRMAGGEPLRYAVSLKQLETMA